MQKRRHRYITLKGVGRPKQDDRSLLLCTVFTVQNRAANMSDPGDIRSAMARMHSKDERSA